MNLTGKERFITYFSYLMREQKKRIKIRRLKTGGP